MLQDFWRVAVRKDIVRLEIFIELGKLQVASRLFARPGCAGFAVAHDATAPRQEPGLDQGVFVSSVSNLDVRRLPLPPESYLVSVSRQEKASHVVF